ncbi:MAG: asparaginase domain-containing protein [Sulfurovaceae bacterium]|nr:asparaginase domain-containing protein [Sulfurovaceae bacterium]
MNNILCINTGGTFNKYYNPSNGLLEVDKTSRAIKSITKKWLCEIDIIDIIGKDSLEFDDIDRTLLLETIRSQPDLAKIIVIHGTDTMHLSAEVLAKASLPHTIVFTGAMVPFSIEPVEAAANFASAAGYISSLENPGVYIAMNGCFGNYKNIIKDRINNKFIYNIN